MEKKSARHTQLSSSEILSLLEQNELVLKKYGVRKLGLFGSYRRGSPTPESDIDFLVIFDHVTFDNYMELKIFLEDLFHCRVDLVLEEAIKPRLRRYILEEVIYAQGL
jgi:predicted nucleotidyltransferase